MKGLPTVNPKEGLEITIEIPEISVFPDAVDFDSSVPSTKSLVIIRGLQVPGAKSAGPRGLRGASLADGNRGF